MVNVNDINSRLMILPGCNADTRCTYWLGALNGETRRGCGINVLRFMGEIDESNAKIGLNQAMNTGQGTPFADVIDWFNKKITNSQKGNEIYVASVTEGINSLSELTRFFRVLNFHLIPNSCTIVKLNRHADPAQRPGNFTPGHYVLISKDNAGKLWTYEPYISKPGDCNRREFKGTISQGFFNAYNKQQGYISASFIEFRKTTVGGGYDNKEEAFRMPEDTMSNFVKDIEMSIVCNVSAKTKRSKTKRKRIKKKTRKMN